MDLGKSTKKAGVFALGLMATLSSWSGARAEVAKVNSSTAISKSDKAALDRLVAQVSGPFDPITVIKGGKHLTPMQTTERNFLINLLTTYTGRDVAKLSTHRKLNLLLDTINVNKLNVMAAKNLPLFLRVMEETNREPVKVIKQYKTGEMFAVQLEQVLNKYPAQRISEFADAIAPVVKVHTPFGHKLAMKLEQISKGTSFEMRPVHHARVEKIKFQLTP